MQNIFLAPTTFGQFSDQPMQLFKQNDFMIHSNQLGRKLQSKEIIKLANNAHCIIAGTELYTKDVLEQLPKLKVISRLGVGIDNIDLVTARERNIKVYKTKTTPAPAVAELAIGLMIDVSRYVSKSNQLLKSDIWKKEMGTLLYGKTLGIIGLGTIGKTLVKLVDGFNFNILAYDLFHDDIFQIENNITYCNLNTLLKESDIVSIHLNLSEQTANMVSTQQLELMKPDSILINVSRGEIVDEYALYKILKDKKILGAGLDVFKEEPYSGPLTQLDNVVLTPHIGSYAKQIRMLMETEAAKNIIKGLQDE
jgi:D-3-phosphoglycerate dehydrogenase